MKKSLYLFVFLSLFISCSHNLEQAEALETIKKEYKNPCVQTLIRESKSKWDDYQSTLEKARELEEKGYVRITSRQISGDYIFAGYTLMNIEVLQASKEFLVNDARSLANAEYVVAIPKILNIIGISQDENEAIVQFSYSYAPTPLHSIRSSSSKRNSKKRDCTSGIVQGEVVFRKYDTGWKMERPKTEEEKYFELLKGGQ